MILPFRSYLIPSSSWFTRSCTDQSINITEIDQPSNDHTLPLSLDPVQQLIHQILNRSINQHHCNRSNLQWSHPSGHTWSRPAVDSPDPAQINQPTIAVIDQTSNDHTLPLSLDPVKELIHQICKSNQPTITAINQSNKHEILPGSRFYSCSFRLKWRP